MARHGEGGASCGEQQVLVGRATDPREAATSMLCSASCHRRTHTWGQGGPVTGDARSGTAVGSNRMQVAGGDGGPTENGAYQVHVQGVVGSTGSTLNTSPLCRGIMRARAWRASNRGLLLAPAALLVLGQYT